MRKAGLLIIFALAVAALSIPVAADSWSGGDSDNNQDSGGSDTGGTGSDGGTDEGSSDSSGSDSGDSTDSGSSDDTDSGDSSTGDSSGDDADSSDDSSDSDWEGGDSDNNDDSSGSDSGSGDGSDSGDDWDGGDSDNNEDSNWTGGDSENNENTDDDGNWTGGDSGNNENTDSGDQQNGTDGTEDGTGDGSGGDGDGDDTGDEGEGDNGDGESGDGGDEEDDGEDNDQDTDQDVSSGGGGGGFNPLSFTLIDNNPGMEVDLRPTTVRAGQPVTVEGRLINYTTRSVTVEVDGERVELTRADTDGNFRTTFTPGQPGGHTVLVESGSVSREFRITVTSNVKIQRIVTATDLAPGRTSSTCVEVTSDSVPDVTLYRNDEQVGQRHSQGRTCFDVMFRSGDNTLRAVAEVPGDRDTMTTTRDLRTGRDQSPTPSAATAGFFRMPSNSLMISLVVAAVTVLGILYREL